MKKTLTILLLSLACFSCEKVFYGEIKPYEKQLFLFAEYSNVNGNAPAINLDLNNSSKAIQINPDNTAVNFLNDRIYMVMSNIRLSDALGTYRINSIDTEVFRDGHWVPEPENFLYPDSVKELDVVLVLDVSSSLGSDVNDVKRYATEFVDFLFQENPLSRIGIVGFSENISSLPLTNDRFLAKDFINDLIGGNATKLYEAMDVGLSLIETSSADGRAMVTFTDGRNNAPTDIKYESPDYIFNRLSASTVNSYTIGFNGKESVDEATLRKLAVRGLSSFPSSVSELSNVFQKFANSVSSVYVLTYDSNKFQVSPIKLRFRLNTTVF